MKPRTRQAHLGDIEWKSEDGVGRVTRVTYQPEDGTLYFRTLYSKRLSNEMSLDDLWQIVRIKPSKPEPAKLDLRQIEHPLLIGGRV